MDCGMSNDTPCTTTLRAEWETCNHMARFEAWATLYYARFHRLSPGKSQPMECYHDDEAENRAQCDDWHKSGLAKHDAIMAVARLIERVEELERQVEDLTDGNA